MTRASFWRDLCAVERRRHWLRNRTRRALWGDQRGYVLFCAPAVEESENWWEDVAWWEPTVTFATPLRTVLEVDGPEGLQDAINNAAFDDADELGLGGTILLEQGAVFDFENVTLTIPAHAETHPITICTSGIHNGTGGFPAWGGTITPGHASVGDLAHITATGTGGRLINILAPAGKWNLRGLKIDFNSGRAGSFYRNDVLVALEDESPYTWETTNRDILFDRILSDIPVTNNFHTNSAVYYLSGRNIMQRGCYVEVYDKTGAAPGDNSTDIKCVEIQHSDNVQLLDGSYIGGSENLFIGGYAYTDRYGLFQPVSLPTNTRVERCLVLHDTEQEVADGWVVKNCIETKGSSRVWINGCLVDKGHTDPDTLTQQSYILSLKAYPNDPGDEAPVGGEGPVWEHVRQWAITNSWVRNGDQMMFIEGYSGNDKRPHTPTSMVRGFGFAFLNSLATGFFAPARPMVFGEGFYDVRIDKAILDFSIQGADAPYVALIADPRSTFETAGAVVSDLTDYAITDSFLLGPNADAFGYGTGAETESNNAFYTDFLLPHGGAISKVAWASNAAESPWNTYAPLFGTDDGDPNWRVVASGYRDVLFEDPDNDDWRVKAAAYQATGARDASDGTDLGPDYTAMYAAMGARVWAACGFPFTP